MPSEALAVAGSAVLVARPNSKNHEANAVAGNPLSTALSTPPYIFLFTQSANLVRILGRDVFADLPVHRGTDRVT